MPGPDDENTEFKIAQEGPTYPCLEILSGPKGGGRLPLKTGKNMIGRSRDNDVVLDDSSVSRRHSVVEVALNGASIADLGSRNGTKVAGQKITQPAPLAHGSQVKIGVFQLRFLTGPAEPAVAEEAEPPEEPPIPEAPMETPEGPVGEEPEAGLPAVREEGGLPAIPIDEELVSELTRKKGKKWILYLMMGLILVGVGVWGGQELYKLFTKKKPLQKVGEKIGEVVGVIPAPKVKMPPKAPNLQPIFLDFSSSPIPSEVFFAETRVGVTPFRITTNLATGKWYEARALFQLPEVGEVVEERAQFSPPEGSSIIPVVFNARIGIFKVAGLPRNSQLYLEGYFEKDPYRAKPIKFAEIVFGKPIYVPFGRYILEIRKSRQLGASQTFIDEVVYRREFQIGELQTTYTVAVEEKDLKIFPVQITSNPPEAKVFIDEKEVGTTPYNGAFPVGEHLLTLKHEGYFDFIQVMKMEINMPYAAEIQLKTSEAGDLINKADALMKEDRYVEALPVLVEAFSKNPSSRETAQISYMVGICYLRQKSYKEAQDYFLKSMQHDDYKFAGRLGIAGITFEEGNSVKALQILVEVLVASEDPKIRADAGQLFQRISPLKSVIYLTSEPSGARVFVNGNEVAERTPLILHDLGVGAYQVEFRKEGYKETEIKLNLGVSEFRPVVAKLQRIGG